MTYYQALQEFKREYWSRLLTENPDKKALELAQAAGVNRTHFYRMVRDAGVELDSKAHRGNWGDLGN